MIFDLIKNYDLTVETILSDLKCKNYHKNEKNWFINLTRECPVGKMSSAITIN